MSNEDPVDLRATHYYSIQQGPQPPGLLKQEDFPWFVKQLQAGRIVAVSSLEEMPAEAAHDREVCRQLGIKSNLSIPLLAGGGPLIGVLGLNTTRAERDWPDALVRQLQLIGQIFANALARRRPEQTLRQKTEELDQFFNISLDLLCVASTDGYFLRLNPSWERIFGYTREQLMAKRFFDFSHPEDLDRTRKAVSILASQKKPIYFGNRYRCKDGTYRWLEWTATPAGNLIYATTRDVSERQRAEEVLHERLRFEHLLSELSVRFVNMPPDRVDSEIEDGLRQVLEFFQVDRCLLLRTLPGKTSWLCTHIASSDNAPPLPVGVELPRSIYPWTYEKLAEKHEVMSIARLDDLPAEAKADRQTCIEMGIQSFVNILISMGESVDHIINANSGKSERVWPEELFPRLKLLGEVFVNALEIKELKQRLERENIYLREEVKLLVEHTEMVGQSLAMKRILAQAEQVARTDSTVLILGETGTGKEVLVRAIHKMSGRKDRPLIAINCASLPPTLVESELFGREKGAYTGAMTKMIGRFEIADGSTFFLDEIGDLPLELQGKLLRVLEEGNFERLGSTKTLHVHVRIIAATNRDIEQEVKDGNFRKDLFYRLNVFAIRIPPLRERPEDVPLLVWTFVREFRKRMRRDIESISKKSMEALQSYSLPGNVRELRNVIEHAMILSEDKALAVHLPNPGLLETDVTQSLQDIERRHIVDVLEKAGWRLNGKGGAAEVLGLKRTTLRAKMQKLGIKRSNKTQGNG